MADKDDEPERALHVIECRFEILAYCTEEEADTRGHRWLMEEVENLRGDLVGDVQKVADPAKLAGYLPDGWEGSTGVYGYPPANAETVDQILARLGVPSIREQRKKAMEAFKARATIKARVAKTPDENQ